MSKMRIVMLGFAVGSAVIAGLMARNLVGKKQPTPEAQIINTVQSVDVLVAAKDIGVGTKMVADTMAWKSWPKENVDAAMITREGKPDADKVFAEARAKIPMYTGEPIMEKKLAIAGNGGFLSAVLPKGMRAISLAISSRSSAGGFILPNDRVDVILTRKLNVQGVTTTQEVVSETVISNVRVLAINQVYKQAPEGEDLALKDGETATLEMTLPQAEVLARVESEGELSLALRSIAESEGRALEEGPQLSEQFNGDPSKKKKGPSSTSQTLFVRYGIETYATQR